MIKPPRPSRAGHSRAGAASNPDPRTKFIASWRADAHRELRRRFPDIFRLLRAQPTLRGPDPVLACRGIEYEPGWHPLVIRLATTLTKITPPGSRPVCVQAKEKFGLLRFYVDRSSISDDVSAAIKAAQEESGHICEKCGRPGRTRMFGRCWLITLCDRHATMERRRRAAKIKRASKIQPLTAKDFAFISSRPPARRKRP